MWKQKSFLFFECLVFCFLVSWDITQVKCVLVSYPVSWCLTLLLYPQADSFCAQIFRQSPVFHLHRPNKDWGVKDLAGEKTTRKWLFWTVRKSLQQQNESKVKNPCSVSYSTKENQSTSSSLAADNWNRWRLDMYISIPPSTIHALVLTLKHCHRPSECKQCSK